ncbi:alkylglycerol monooxygenase-like isoform X2 [Lytechinus pictus]|uniref:alkylglycerol monooxygenase-like isoform X2 n=2 Tax=Lytechinus pictus TaxID=7653 RepID=UPI0030B9F374
MPKNLKAKAFQTSIYGTMSQQCLGGRHGTQGKCIKVTMNGFFKVDGVTGMRRMFYAVTPNETSFRTLDEVPEYIIEAAPFFFISVIIEEVYLRYHDGGKDDRFADSITSLIAGMFMVITGLFTKAIELGIYVYVFDNFCIYELPWDSVWTWLFSFLAIDLGYYWFHRMSHEVNIFWASHQVHHSSEEFNLTTALRQPIFEKCYIWIIENLGPLEYILNTPSHHRVHHGRNRYCIDKNYAGTLIVWDRMFGTFAEEDERVAYGLVHPLTTYNPISVQFCHLQWMWSVFWSNPGLMNKISVIFKGPGWEPGKPRTGLIEDIPDICGPELNKFKTTIPRWMRAYILFHFAINFILYQMFIDHHTELSPVLVLAVMLYQIYTFTCIGMLCNIKPWWNVLAEMMRCALVFALTTFLIHQDGEPVNALLFLQMIYGLSMVFWFVHNRFPNDGAKRKLK